MFFLLRSTNEQKRETVRETVLHFFIFMFKYVAQWSCEARHFVPLYVSTYSRTRIKLTWLELPWIFRLLPKWLWVWNSQWAQWPQERKKRLRHLCGVRGAVWLPHCLNYIR